MLGIRCEDLDLYTSNVLRSAILLLLGAGSVCAKDGVEAMLAALASEKSPGVAVLVSKDGRTVSSHFAGVRDLRTFAKIDAHTNFRLASCTKQFTAMAAMLLVHDGKLRYDDRLTDVFPDFPGYGRAITIRELLTHTAGLPDYEDLMEDADKGKGPAWTPARQIRDEEVLELLKRRHPNSPRARTGLTATPDTCCSALSLRKFPAGRSRNFFAIGFSCR